jgi:hypothetical protein
MATKMTGPGKKPKLNAPGNTQQQNIDAYWRKQKNIEKGQKIIGGAVTLGTVAGTAAALLSKPENRAAVKKGLKKVGGAIKQGATAVKSALQKKGDWVSDPNDSSKMIREKAPSRRAVPRPK